VSEVTTSVYWKKYRPRVDPGAESNDDKADSRTASNDIHAGT